MIWRGQWDGQWDGQWEGADEPLAPGFVRGRATISVASVGRLAASDEVTEQPSDYGYGWATSQTWRRSKARPGYMIGHAAIVIEASGVLQAREADVIDLRHHDDAALMFAVGWR
jgi:hypothetical protein